MLSHHLLHAGIQIFSHLLQACVDLIALSLLLFQLVQRIIDYLDFFVKSILHGRDLVLDWQDNTLVFVAGFLLDILHQCEHLGPWHVTHKFVFEINEQGAFEVDVISSIENGFIGLRSHTLVGSRDDGDQEVQKNDEVGHDCEDPENPAVVLHEGNDFWSFSLLLVPEAIDWSCFVSKCIPEGLHQVDKVSVESSIFTLIIGNNDTCDSVEQTDDDQEDQEEEHERNDINCYRSHHLNQQDVLLVNSEEHHELQDSKE